MDAILLAAGVGIRMRLGYPKQFLKINGKPIFIYSLEILQKCKKFNNVFITCNKEYLEDYKSYIEEYHIKDTVCIIGGETRQESVKIALEYVKTDRVLIHEAARPLISVDFINDIIKEENEVAVIPTIPIKFTVAEGCEYMEKELNRERLHNIQLPQVFDTAILKSSHEKAVLDNYIATEDGMLVFHYGNKVKFISGRESNIKVTTILDVEVVEKLLKLS